MRGFVLISRCIGLVAHLAEEQVQPAGRALWDAAAHAIDYVDGPDADR
jgi:citrate synthase